MCLKYYIYRLKTQFLKLFNIELKPVKFTTVWNTSS